MKKRAAFSLVELSLVILVIGLLVAGIAQGRGMVMQAKLRAAQMQTAQSPVNDIPNLVVWYETTATRSFDASEAVDGATVSTWYDLNSQSLAAVNATQSTSSYRPLYSTNVSNSLPMLKFDTTAYRYFTMPNGTVPYNNSNYTVFLVSRTTACGSLCVILFSGDSGANSFNSFYYTDTGVSDIWSSNNLSATVSTVNLHVFSFLYNNSVGRTIYIDGTSSATLSNTNRTSTSGNNCIGGCNSHADGLNGYIGELIIFGRALKNEERKSVEKYLSRKWGIAVS